MTGRGEFMMSDAASSTVAMKRDETPKKKTRYDVIIIGGRSGRIHRRDILL